MTVKTAAKSAAGAALGNSGAEEQMAKFARGSTPWIAWLLGIPAAVVAFGAIGRVIRQPGLVAGSLAAVAVMLAVVVWKLDHSRRWWGKAHHAMNALGSVGLIAAAVRYGWTGLDGKVLVAYGVGGLAMTLLWNVRHTQRQPGVQEVMAQVARPEAVTGRLVRTALVLAKPDGRVAQAAAVLAPEAAPQLTAPGGPAPAPAPARPSAQPRVTRAEALTAAERAKALVGNFHELTQVKAKPLEGASLVILDVQPWRIRSEVRLVPGRQVPKDIISLRETLASQNALPLPAVLIKQNPARHDRVYIDWVLADVLARSLPWPGPQSPGVSIAEAPALLGVYEDRVPLLRLGPAVTPELAARTGLPEKNLSHLIYEGMNGSGKSSAARLLLADGASRLDVEEWVIDTVKKTQTYGQLAQAISWFAATPAEARALIRFLADWVIPARADYLGTRGFDNWIPGCGLPYLRVTVEEGGIISNELDKLDAVLNSARSTGTEVNLSIQRAHSAVLDTNVRAAFGDTMSFGAKELDDVFAMPPELIDAGADPSVWTNKHPGKCYYAPADQELERWLMVARTYTASADELRDVIAEHEPRRRAWIGQNCPDWHQLLAGIDKRGVWAKRTTGDSVLAEIERVRPRAAAAAPPGVNRPPAPEVPAVPGGSGSGSAPPGRTAPAPDRDTDPAPGAGADPDDGPEDDVALDDLDLPADLAAGMREDREAGIDPRSPVPDPGPNVDFGLPPGEPASREQSLAVLRSILIQLGDGHEFAPRDLYDEIRDRTGRSAGWTRTELGTTLEAEGLVRHDRGAGRYTVTLRPAAQDPDPDGGPDV